MGIKSWMTIEYFVQIDGDGEEKTVYFHGKKKLKVNAYFRVEIGEKYSGDSYYGIDRYEEVKPEDMPKK
ncbi:hypothetical protein PDQ40_08395 [Bacillus cereus group sp. Bc061]|uniref:hypothetical protein n=1 Tax=Bacillus cereus group sp. Bc061 TaxID=3018117 RepID=UPI0022E0DC37|nr:hypothetical protein [Bacillus cereus group sp. Bc061]MDA2595669.1 hypothetical protein [Bacillus cereus group sp. Bc061]